MGRPGYGGDGALSASMIRPVDGVVISTQKIPTCRESGSRFTEPSTDGSGTISKGRRVAEGGNRSSVFCDRHCNVITLIGEGTVTKKLPMTIEAYRKTLPAFESCYSSTTDPTLLQIQTHLHETSQSRGITEGMQVIDLGARGWGPKTDYRRHHDAMVKDMWDAKERVEESTVCDQVWCSTWGA